MLQAIRNFILGVEPDTPEPEPEEKRELEISEPVTSFIRSVKANPSRFELTLGEYTYRNQEYTLKDKVENIEFKFSTYYGSLATRLYLEKPSGLSLTEDERDALYALLKHYQTRQEKFEKLTARRKYTNIYRKVYNEQ